MAFILEDLEEGRDVSIEAMEGLIEVDVWLSGIVSAKLR